MLAFLKANVYNIIVIAIVLLVVFLIIRKIGKSAVCGGDCSKCHANCSHKN